MLQSHGFGIARLTHKFLLVEREAEGRGNVAFGFVAETIENGSETSVVRGRGHGLETSGQALKSA